MYIPFARLYRPKTFSEVVGQEVRAFRERKKRSVWCRELGENCVGYGDRGYRGCEGGIVCDSREMRAKRQVVEGGISQIKLFNAGSGFEEVKYGMLMMVLCDREGKSL